MYQEQDERIVASSNHGSESSEFSGRYNQIRTGEVNVLENGEYFLFPETLKVQKVPMNEDQEPEEAPEFCYVNLVNPDGTPVTEIDADGAIKQCVKRFYPSAVMRSVTTVEVAVNPTNNQPDFMTIVRSSGRRKTHGAMADLFRSSTDVNTAIASTRKRCKDENKVCRYTFDEDADRVITRTYRPGPNDPKAEYRVIGNYDLVPIQP